MIIRQNIPLQNSQKQRNIPDQLARRKETEQSQIEQKKRLNILIGAELNLA